MMLVWPLIACLLVAGGQAWRQDKPDSPEQEGLWMVQDLIYDGRHQIVNALMGVLSQSVKDDFLLTLREVGWMQENDMMSTTGRPGPTLPPITLDPDCASCRLVLEGFRSLLADGHDWDSLRDLTNELCHDLIGEAYPNTPTDVICPVSLENYAPHVLEMLNTSQATSHEICTLHNNCVGDEDVRQTVVSEGRTWPAAEKKEYDLKKDAFKVMHLTDAHLDHLYQEGAPTLCFLPVCCRDHYDGFGEASFWGEYSCNTAVHTINRMLELASDMQPDLIMYTGDSPPNVVWEETMDGQLGASRLLTQRLKEYFPDTPVYPSIGNHELFPTNLYYVERYDGLIKEFNDEFGKMWSDLAGFQDEQRDQIDIAGFYAIDVPGFPGLRVLTYNSNYGATDNFYGSIIGVSEEYYAMIDFMENEFDTARAEGKKILLLGHHHTGGGGSFIHHGQFISDICRRNGDLIILHLLGHSHGDGFRMTYDHVDQTAYNVQISSPASTSRTDVNPSVRMFYIDRDTFRPLDYEQYHFDLRLANETSEDPPLHLFYSASADYGMPDLTPASYNDFTMRMEEDADLFDLYRYHDDTGVHEVSECSESCRHSEFCKLRTTSYDMYRDCNDA